MINTKLSKFYSLFSALAVPALIAGTPPAFARDKAGNGGGAHVCRDPNTHAIRTIEFYDLYEARARYGFTPSIPPGQSEKEIFESAMKRLDLAAESLAVRSRAMLPVVLAKLDIRSGSLLPTLDSDRMLVDAGCEYEQVAVWDERTGKIFVDRSLYEALGTIGRAALLAHEAIYKLARIYSDQTNSDETRLLVGRLFSDTPVRTEIDGKYGKIFQTFGATLYDEKSPVIVDRGNEGEDRALSLRILWQHSECYDYSRLKPTEVEDDEEPPVPFPVRQSDLATDQRVSLTFDRYWLKVFRDREEWDRRLGSKTDDLVLDGDFFPAEPSNPGQPYRLDYLTPFIFTGQNFLLSSGVKTELDPNVEAEVRIDVTNPLCGETQNAALLLRPGATVEVQIEQ